MKPENPQAFPNSGQYQTKGMTLRDRFAEKAMYGILSAGLPMEMENIEIMVKNIGKVSYNIADAMLKAMEE